MFIPHNRPTLGEEEVAAAQRVIESAWVAQGKEVSAFEEEICNFLGLERDHAIVVSSGSAALYLALLALNGQGKRIGVPVYSCSALANAVSLVQGQADFLDVKKDSPNIDLNAISKQVDIVLAPSMFGIPVSFDNQFSFQVVEDIAQALGAMQKGSKIGLRGDIGICSFYASKLITSGGQGGAVISRNRDYIDFIRDYREFDCRADKRSRFNFQLTDLQAAVGRVQLKRLPIFIERRQELFQIYLDHGLPLLDDLSASPVRYRAIVRTENAESLIRALEAEGIKSIIPIEEYELLDVPMHYPNAFTLTQETVSLPIYPGLTNKDAQKVATIVKDFI